MHQIVVPPQPTPQQQRQLQLEAERRALEARIAAERARLEEERAAQLAQLQAERVALREQQRLMRSTSGLKPTPSTDFTPVSARKTSRASLAPEHTDGSVLMPDQSHRARSDSLDSAPHNRLLRFEEEAPRLEQDSELEHAGRLEQDSELEHAREQEEELQRLQQQKELRDLQHRQQMLHQRHQQQVLQLQEAQRSHSYREPTPLDSQAPLAGQGIVPVAAWDDLEMSLDSEYLGNA